MVSILYLHCRNPLNLNRCGMNNALLFQTFKNCCKSKKTDATLNHVRLCADKVFHVWEKECVGTWWKFHLSEAFDWRRDGVSVNQDVKLLPDALISGVWHVQDIARCLPATSTVGSVVNKKGLPKKKRIHWSRTHLVFMGSSYMIPLAISFTDIRADRGERVSLESVLTFWMFRK